MLQIDETVGSGFWCYTHFDEEKSRGKILRLADLISSEFGLMTGTELKLFTDRSIEWGQLFREQIATSLVGANFFIPIITPAFFKSEECRGELLSYYNYAKQRGAVQLVLPILFIDVEDLEEKSQDSLKALVAGIQWFDWRGLRLEDEDSSAYSKAVNLLALRIKEIASEVVSMQDGRLDIAEENSDTGDDEKGILDLISQGEETLPKWQEVIEGFGITSKEIQEKTEVHLPSIRDSKKASQRLFEIRAYVDDIQSSADEMLRLSPDPPSCLG